MKFTVIFTIFCACTATALAQAGGGASSTLPTDANVMRPSSNNVPEATMDSSKTLAEQEPAPSQQGVTPKNKIPSMVNRIAATVNGKPITSGEVAMRLRPVLGQLAAQYPDMGSEFVKNLTKAKRGILEDLIDRELVLQEFEAKGGMFRESYVDQEINNIIMQDFKGDRDKFMDNLKQMKVSLREFREEQKKNQILGYMRSTKYDNSIPPTPEELRKEYALSKSRFRDQNKDKVTFKKIFIPMVGMDTASNPDVQYELSKIIVEELNKGASFSDLAKRYSKDKYAGEGGQWPTVERSELSAEFASIIFDSKPDKIVGPLADPTGFTILVVQSKSLASAPPMAKVRDEIDDIVRAKRSNAQYKKWVDRLRERAIIKKYI